jgi:type II secretory pathway component PulF
MKKMLLWLSAHAFVSGLEIALLLFVVPVFGDMFADFGVSLPYPTRLVLGVSLWLRRYLFFLIPPMLGLFVFDGAGGWLLQQRVGKGAATAWWATILALLVAAFTLMLLALWTPMMVMQEVVQP